MQYFYPRPPRGGRRIKPGQPPHQQDFYPRPPRGGRPASPAFRRRMCRFLSTPSARRATLLMAGLSTFWSISIHALREEGDQHSGARRPSLNTFLSTPSARRATRHDLARVVQRPISIHALREEGDILLAQTRSGKSYFYPRPPRGGRPSRLPKTYTEYIFLSTPSARRATKELWETKRKRQISIHALREEGDVLSRWQSLSKQHFYPRPPRGGRPTRCLL